MKPGSGGNVDAAKTALLMLCRSAGYGAQEAALDVIQGSTELTPEQAKQLAYEAGLRVWNRTFWGPRDEGDETG